MTTWKLELLRPLLCFFIDILVPDHVEAVLLTILLISFNLVEGYLVGFSLMLIGLLEHIVQLIFTSQELLRLETLLLHFDNFFEGFMW